MKRMKALSQGKIQPPLGTGPEHQRLLRAKGCIISVYFSITTGGQRRTEIVVLGKGRLDNEQRTLC